MSKFLAILVPLTIVTILVSVFVKEYLSNVPNEIVTGLLLTILALPCLAFSVGIRVGMLISIREDKKRPQLIQTQLLNPLSPPIITSSFRTETIPYTENGVTQQLIRSSIRSIKVGHETFEVKDKYLERFIRLERPTRQNWQGKTTEYSACLALALAGGIVYKSGQDYQWAISQTRRATWLSQIQNLCALPIH